jgi:acyl-CoA thioesterase-1
MFRMKDFAVALVFMSCVSASLFAQEAEKKPVQKPAPKPSPAFEKIVEDPALPRVFLIGDSISIGYTIPVRKLLQGKANVLRPADNCGPTTKGLERMDKWLDVGKLDVIHFNFGLHDLRLMPKTNQCQVEIKTYEENLRKIVARLKQTGAKLVWATTTAVVDGPNRKRRNQDVAEYNEAALRVIKAEGIEVDDLYAELMKNPDREKLTTPEGTHFTPEGYELLAKSVAASILKALGK